MNHDETLKMIYITFFSLVNLIAPLLFYLFSVFTEYRVRSFAKLVEIPDPFFNGFLFLGIKGEDKVVTSLQGLLCQYVSPVFFLLMEAICIIYSKLTGDSVTPCRFSMIIAAPLVVFWIVFAVVTIVKIIKSNKEQ